MSLTCSVKMGEFYGVQNIAQYENFKYDIKVLIPNHSQSRLEKLNTAVRIKPIGGVSDLGFLKKCILNRKSGCYNVCYNFGICFKAYAIFTLASGQF